MEFVEYYFFCWVEWVLKFWGIFYLVLVLNLILLEVCYGGNDIEVVLLFLMNVLV